MTIIIEDKLMKNIRITQEEAKLDFALGLFIDYKATLRQAAIIANLTQAKFMKELGKRKIPIHYGIDEFNKDVETLKKHNLI